MLPGEISKESCCGCEACANACPLACIVMRQDEEGFLYPWIDRDVCSDCGLCEQVCPVLNKPKRDKIIAPPLVLAAWSKDGTIRRFSSSGGVFSSLANCVLEQEGIVYGAAFDNGFRVVHRAAWDKQGLKELRGSKYLQSRIGEVYKEIQRYLTQGRKVLFSGTPCQVAGVYAFLGKEYENFLTCDLVCHGVPSPEVFRKYLKHIEERYNSKAVSISFRDKRRGWKIYNISIRFENGNEYSLPVTQDAFMQGFLQDVYLRPSCHSCLFKGFPRAGDITLGDFWGIGANRPDLDDDQGTSLVLLNTEKGKRMFEECSGDLFYSECSLEQAIAGNPALVRSVVPSKRRERFFQDFEKLPFDQVIKKYMRPPSKIRAMISRSKAIVKAVLGKGWRLIKA